MSLIEKPSPSKLRAAERSDRPWFKALGMGYPRFLIWISEELVHSSDSEELKEVYRAELATTVADLRNIVLGADEKSGDEEVADYAMRRWYGEFLPRRLREIHYENTEFHIARKIELSHATWVVSLFTTTDEAVRIVANIRDSPGMLLRSACRLADLLWYCGARKGDCKVSWRSGGEASIADIASILHSVDWSGEEAWGKLASAFEQFLIEDDRDSVRRIIE